MKTVHFQPFYVPPKIDKMILLKCSSLFYLKKNQFANLITTPYERNDEGAAAGPFIHSLEISLKGEYVFQDWFSVYLLPAVLQRFEESRYFVN